MTVFHQFYKTIEESEYIDSGNDIVVSLQVKEVTSIVTSDEKKTITAALKDKQLMSLYLDIQLTK